MRTILEEQWMMYIAIPDNSDPRLRKQAPKESLEDNDDIEKEKELTDVSVHIWCILLTHLQGRFTLKPSNCPCDLQESDSDSQQVCFYLLFFCEFVLILHKEPSMVKFKFKNKTPPV